MDKSTKTLLSRFQLWIEALLSHFEKWEEDIKQKEKKETFEHLFSSWEKDEGEIKQRCAEAIIEWNRLEYGLGKDEDKLSHYGDSKFELDGDELTIICSTSEGIVEKVVYRLFDEKIIEEVGFWVKDPRDKNPEYVLVG